MEIKKSPKADLESKRGIFMLIGLVFALSLCLMAFEWGSSVQEVEQFGQLAGFDVDDEIIPITRQEEVKPPPPPPPPKVVDVINIVDDETEIEEELEIEDTEADDETVIDVSPILEEEEEVEEDKIFFFVEEQPEFPGGERALVKFLSSSVKYPVIAQENGIQGKVYVTFVVEKDGSVTDATILRGADPSLNKEALRVVSLLPKWKPGKQGGRAVRVSYRVPIDFQLQ